jgi:hypothetical protein
VKVHTKTEKTKMGENKMERTKLVLALPMVFTIFVTNCAFVYAGWSVKTVDGPSKQGEWNSLALDGNGYPHISYYGYINGHMGVRYAKWTGSSWDIKIVDTDTEDACSSIAVDGSGYPHISYVKSLKLMYTKWNGSDWTYADGTTAGKEVVDSGCNSLFNSIAVDSNNRPHIAYYDQSNAYLKYTRWKDGAWRHADGITVSTETVDNSGSTGNYTRMALDGSDQPHIVYYDWSGSDHVKYAKWTGSWSTPERLPDSPVDGLSNAIDIDSNGYAHIFSNRGTDIDYWRWTGGGWADSGLGWPGDHKGISMALDENDYPHISCADNTNQNLEYRKWTGSAWSGLEIIDSGVGGSYLNGEWTSIVLDTACYSPHISYYDKTNEDLKYAVWINTPTAFGGVAISTGEIKWSWQDNEEGEEAYRVHTDTHGIIISLDPSTTSWLETGLSPNTLYTRHGNVLKDGGDDDSNSAPVYTLASVPSSLISTGQTGSTISLSWSGDGTKYAIERATDVGGNPGSWTPIKEWDDNISETTYTDTGLSKRTTYWYMVSAYNGDQKITDPSNAVNAFTMSNSAPTLTWTKEANYTTDGLHPEEGNTSTSFVYRVSYTDEDDDAPKSEYPKVHIKQGGIKISGSPFTMNEADIGDVVYNDGKLYTYSTTLDPGTDYSYYFEAYDEYDAAATGTPTTLIDAPDITNIAPTLSWTGETNYTSDGLSPETGKPETTFTFRVKYTDTDNGAPKSDYPKVHIKRGGKEITGSPFIMDAIDSGDTTYTDGKLYNYSLSLAGGDYTYYFEVYDIYGAKATGEPTIQKSGPVVIGKPPETKEMKVYHGVFKSGENEKCYVSFNLEKTGETTIKVYNSLGREVKQLYSGTATPGLNTIPWDGTDGNGNKVSSGVYIIRIEGPLELNSKKELWW